jgi:hypothetical protein
MDFDVWINSRPAFSDIDADGDLDMFLGKYTFWYSPHGVEYYENTGTSSTPVFSYRYDIVTQDPNGNHDGTAPTLCDIDDDGDKDLFIGEMYGVDVWAHLIFFENTGDATRPRFELNSWEYQDLTFGTYSYPAFCDIDDDGDFDLFVGQSGDPIFYYQNIGTPDSAYFELVDDDFLDVDEGYYMYDICPNFNDIDHDGDYDLFVGYNGGGLKFYRNVGTSIAPEFHREFGLNDYKLYQNYPNPFNTSTNITLSIPTTSNITLSVYNSLGQKVDTIFDGSLKQGESRFNWNAEKHSSGMYYISLETQDQKQTQKAILLK